MSYSRHCCQCGCGIVPYVIVGCSDGLEEAVGGLGHRPSAVRARCTGDKPHLSRPMYSAGTLRATRPSVQAGAVMTDKSQAIVDVDLGDRSYPIYIGPGLLDQPNLLQEHVPGKKVLVVTNETVAPLYLDRCVAALTKDSDLQVGSVVLPDGEKYKSVDIVQKVWDAAIEQRLDRNTTFVALGGGVIGDMTGFAAACWVRGCHFIQVDSSVGGKTGVNHPGGKNMIGAFYQPQAVLVDINCLDTLPDRELASGISEIIKYGLIRDAEFFGWLEENIDRLLARDTEAFVYAIERSCINKAEVVAEDEKEGGVRASLNLGHTFGHAIETHTGYGSWLHGEAVAAGTLMAMDLSKRMGWVEPDIVERARALLLKCKLPSEPPAGMDPQRFLDIMSLDKKVKDGKLRLVLLKGPLGTCVITSEYDQQMLQQTLEAFCH